MNYVEFTRQSPDKLQLYFQGWEPEASLRAVVCLVHGLGEHTGRYAHVAASAERGRLCRARLRLARAWQVGGAARPHAELRHLDG